MSKWFWTAAASVLAGAGLAGSVAWAASRPVVPTRAEIQDVMHGYHEAGMTQETYRPLWKTVTRSDSHGVVDTAVVGMRWPTADGLGQVVFFFAGKRFLGVNSTKEVYAVSQIRAVGEGVFAVTYANYKPTDPAVDPTLPPYTVDYRVTSQGVAASRSLPPTVLDRQTAQRKTAGLPSRLQMLREARQYHEVGTAGETLQPEFNTLVATHSSRSVLSAVIANRWPTADGYGQVVLFFRGTQFLGLNAMEEATSIQKLSPDGPQAFRVTFANYKPTDAMADPTLPPVTVVYRIIGNRIVPSRSLPPGVTNKLGLVRDVAQPTSP